jgi:enoyl-CoA hydratase/carnithine racemase
VNAQSGTVLRVEQHGAVRKFVLNRPQQRNALDAKLIEALTAALSDAEQDATTHAVLITGTGPSFCAGADLRHLLALHEASNTPVSFLHTVSAFTRRLETSPLPIVAVLHGHAVAGGLEIALACDVVVAEAGTLIGDGHIRNHLVPGAGASVRMRARLGDALGRWLALSGELLPAERFLSAGWLHAVVESGHGATEGQRLAEILAGTANPAQSAYKRLFADLDETPPLTVGLDLELDAFERHWANHDVPHALRAFLIRRAAG